MEETGSNTNPTDLRRAIRLTREAMQDSTVESIRAATSQLGASLQSFDKEPLIIDMSQNGIPAHVSIEYTDGRVRVRGMFNDRWAEIGFKKPGIDPDPFKDLPHGMSRISQAEVRSRITSHLDFFGDNIIELHARAEALAVAEEPAPVAAHRQSRRRLFRGSRRSRLAA